MPKKAKKSVPLQADLTSEEKVIDESEMKLGYMCECYKKVQEQVAGVEQELKLIKKDKEDWKNKIIQRLKKDKLTKVSFSFGTFSLSEKEIIHFPAKDDLMGRKACVRYISKLLGPDGLITLVTINYSSLSKLRDENQEHLKEYWAELKKENEALEVTDETLLPGIKSSFKKEDLRITKK